VKALSPGWDAPEQASYSGWAMSIFVAGWATGGLIFGAVGDRIGRAKTLAMTVLIYSLFTGCPPSRPTGWQFMIYRCADRPRRRRRLRSRRGLGRRRAA
jgi:MFS family permease